MSSSSSSIPRIQVFRPTMEEFKNFSQYIEKMESQNAHKAGLAKIIPPDGWTPRKHGYDDIDLKIPSPISQIVTGRQGLYQQINLQQKTMTVKEFKVLANSSKYKTPNHFDYEDLERKYWRNITFTPPIYGADVSGSLYDPDVEEFNIQRLNTILDLVKEDYEIQIEGVNTAYLYFGMWKTTFAWHTEDMDLYSINYLHFGAPKSWYVIPPEHGRRLERLAAGFFNGSFQSCPAFLRHKMTIISPSILKQYSIPYQKITQEPGEFMITFPFGYHSGFNHGFNCAESTNFASPRWIEYGKRTTSCTCRNDCVKICMDMFVRKFQPDKYELWKVGKDFGTHPEDPSKHFAAPPPRKFELALAAQRERKCSKDSSSSQKIKRHPISKVDKGESSKPARSKLSKVNYRESDEETELYDVDEVITTKCYQKSHKSNKKAVRKEIKANEVETSPAIKQESIKNEIVVEVKKEDSDEHGIVTEAHVTEGFPEDSIKLSNLEMNPASGPMSITPVKKESSLEVDKACSSNLNILLHPETKDKNPIALSKYSGNLAALTSHLDLFSQFPNLRNAIDSGAFSVVPVSSNPGESTLSSDKSFFPYETSKSPFASKTTNLDATWTCEPLNTGLKLKISQPKKIRQSAPASLSSDQLSNQTSSFSETDSLPATDTASSPEMKIEKPKKKKSDDNNFNGKGNKKPRQSPTTPQKKTNRNNTSTSRSSRGESSQGESSPNGSKIQRADDTVGSWAHPLRNLWQYLPKDFEAEIEFNQKLANIPPHCAICSIFTPMLDKSKFPTDTTSNLPSFSTVKMPLFCYGNNLTSECMMDTNSLSRSDGTAPVLSCSVCKVAVHASCYGVSMLPLGSWMCTRCTKNATDADCCLCVLRGGALKPTTDNRWAHVICAILVAESYFENTQQKQPINVSDIPPMRYRLRCKYCAKTQVSYGKNRACVQCHSGKCYLPFHVTCGYMAGVIFESNDWPEPINMICTKHVTARRKPPKRQLTNISVGEGVIAKHKNKRYYLAKVKNMYVQEYYSILFDDNSHSTNTLPQDIVSRDIDILGPPEMNEKVKVRWPDGKIYNGLFKGSQSAQLYVIEFDDGSELHQERKTIYGADEALPKEVQTKLSTSSERRADMEEQVEGKRIRLANQKYTFASNFL